jgi:Protein of unknown function (DUF1091)
LIYKKAGNEFKLTPFHVGPYKFCDYVQNYALTYDEILKVTDFPQREDCPWEKRKYTIQGYRIPTEKIPAFMDGDYMTEVRILMNKKLMQGFQMSFTVMKFQSGWTEVGNDFSNDRHLKVYHSNVSYQTRKIEQGVTKSSLINWKKKF